MAYRILSLDGGGLRGLITAKILERLNEEESIAGWLDSVDLVAGTSTGGIIALGLSAGKSPNDLANLYMEKGRRIFDDSVFDNVRDLGKTIGADYSNQNLKSELRDFFGGIKLNELQKKVVIPAFDLDNKSVSIDRTWKPKIFHNFSGVDSDGNSLASDVALYTSSAPTYFPSADGFIDGGVYANNPSIVALAQAVSSRNNIEEKVHLDDIVMLSIGTGVSFQYIKGDTLDWGYSQWAKPLLDVLMDGVAGVSDYQAAQFLGNRYCREQVFFGPGEVIKLDAVDKLGRMNDIACEHNIEKTIKWIINYWLV
ncbi:patatin-like phospholipase family protein [Aeromonas hydrophila]|uniref:patatin-like phospholipase family protein n=1 Tax=Aeromonas hydrophila TaxID=644 RepID=UPI0038D0F9D4